MVLCTRTCSYNEILILLVNISCDCCRTAGHLLMSVVLEQIGPCLMLSMALKTVFCENTGTAAVHGAEVQPVPLMLLSTMPV